MAGGATAYIVAIPVIVLSFKLVLLGLIIFGTISYVARDQTPKAKIIVSVLTVIVYGMSDFIIQKLLQSLCPCTVCAS
jgi:hypothetical protein